MAVIIILVIFGIILLAVEVFLLPGITVAGIGAFLASGFAIYKAFTVYGTVGGLITIGALLVLSIIVMAVGLKAKTWHRLALHDNIDSAAQVLPEQEGIHRGDIGTTTTRLAPMGKISINGKIYEAKSEDEYIDERNTVVVTGFDNFSVVVRRLRRQ